MNANHAFLAKGLFTLIMILFLSGPTLAEDITIYDKDYRVQERIQDRTIYGRDWGIKGHIEDGKVYDRNWNLKGNMKKGK